MEIVFFFYYFSFHLGVKRGFVTFVICTNYATYDLFSKRFLLDRTAPPIFNRHNNQCSETTEANKSLIIYVPMKFEFWNRMFKVSVGSRYILCSFIAICKFCATKNFTNLFRFNDITFNINMRIHSFRTHHHTTAASHKSTTKNNTTLCIHFCVWDSFNVQCNSNPPPSTQQDTSYI